MTAMLQFFHGTHSGNSESIELHGLTPLQSPKSVMRGNLSTLENFTEHLVFLAPCPEEAAYYAKEQAISAGTEPVIYSVLVEDRSKLSVSDDYINRKTIEAMLETCKLPGLEFDDHGDVHEYGTSSDQYYFWREVVSTFHRELMDGSTFDEVLNSDKFRCFEDDLENACNGADPCTIWKAMGSSALDALHHSWDRSIETDRDPSVGYKGTIPASDLRRIPEQGLAKALNGIARGLGESKTWDLESLYEFDIKKGNRTARP